MIKQCNSKLHALLNLNCLSHALYAKGLLTDQELQELGTESSVPSKQNSNFIQKILPFKGEQSFKIFLNVLEDDEEHSGHKELFDCLNCCYKETCAGNENDLELRNLTKRQLELVLGELIKEAVRDQFKEMMTLQRKHEEKEVNRHKTLMSLINSLFNQQRNNNGLDAEEDQRRISTISNTTSFTTGSMVGSTYSADCEESDTLSIFSDFSGVAAEDTKLARRILSSPDDEHSVCCYRYTLHNDSAHIYITVMDDCMQ